MSNWVIAIRPNTFVENIPSMSASAISPTCSTPRTYPALLTADRSDKSKEGGSDHELDRTKDVDFVKILWNLGPKIGDLPSVRHIYLHSGEFSA
jgi:hypothetical protein